MAPRSTGRRTTELWAARLPAGGAKWWPSDLDAIVPAERVTAVGRAHYESLSRDAAVNDFIPLLVYRFAKEELIAGRRDDLHEAA
jgi:hypothetical protein